MGLFENKYVEPSKFKAGKRLAKKALTTVDVGTSGSFRSIQVTLKPGFLEASTIINTSTTINNYLNGIYAYLEEEGWEVVNENYSVAYDINAIGKNVLHFFIFRLKRIVK